MVLLGRCDILDTDVVDGVNLAVEGNGQARECGTGRFAATEHSLIRERLPYAVWLVSMLGSLCCPILRAPWIDREAKC